LWIFYYVTNTSSPISVEAGGFRIYGNKVASNNSKYEGGVWNIFVSNPASNYFTLNTTTKVQVF
jgi:hypothetical protein